VVCTRPAERAARAFFMVVPFPFPLRRPSGRKKIIFPTDAFSPRRNSDFFYVFFGNIRDVRQMDESEEEQPRRPLPGQASPSRPACTGHSPLARRAVLLRRRQPAAATADQHASGPGHNLQLLHRRSPRPGVVCPRLAVFRVV